MPYYLHSDPAADDGYWRNAGLTECARGDQCTDPRLLAVDGTTRRAPALTPRVFCAADEAVIAQVLAVLPARWRDVHAELGTKRQSSGPKVAVSKTAPIPLSENADELLRDIVAILTSWEERVAAVARLHIDTDASRRRRAHIAVDAAARTLTKHLAVLLALPAEPMMRAVSLTTAATLPRGTRGLVREAAGYAEVFLDLSGADAGLEVLQLLRRCRRLLGETPPPVRRLDGVACGGCGFSELREVLDDDGVMAGARCWECGTDYTTMTYNELVDEQRAAATRAGCRRRGLARADNDDVLSRRA
ncbi:hypothetical protein Ssi03_50780 [Sphaerisporangium siamense]|uniref:Uncharacterized protein n=1 Tax=Sphaerisporangium siamense TaxID=795645 RepID=A0A7W7G8W9_9ACTN|nr:hypothetical protein [Sphaerisporangium siamense]MBB4702218.1 hypothetical protein [Sphaerisporangium siamense]GII87088.1 hypothetical protein Ssi03_50780 [Sphaerisporangium siamense]